MNPEYARKKTPNGSKHCKYTKMCLRPELRPDVYSPGSHGRPQDFFKGWAN